MDGERESSASHPRWHLVLATAFFVVAIFLLVGRVGFHPTDEGFITSASYRLLRGQIPHQDIASVRPLGSAFLHVVDVLLPTPLLLTSRLIALLEVVAYTTLFAVLVDGRSPRRWPWVLVLGTATAVLVNVHTFPLMAWHTVDGLLLVSGGFVVLQRGLRTRSEKVADLGLAVLGASALVKQSFVPALAIGMVWFVGALRCRGRFRVAELIRGSACGAGPIAVYALLVAMGGGTAHAWNQLTSGRTTIGKELLTSFSSDRSRLGLLLTVAVTLVLLALPHIVRRAAADLGTRVGMGSMLVLTLVTDGNLEFGGTWGVQLFWVLTTIVVWRAVVDRRVDGSALLVLLAAWMASLSWGYARPNLVAGSLALTIMHRAWTWQPALDHASLRGRSRSSGIAWLGAALVFAVGGALFVHQRRANPYRDLGATELTASIGGFDDSFSGVQTNPSTARYLRQIQNCIRSHPAARVAVLPDNAVIYAALSIHNPFPMDWMYPLETDGLQKQILESARELAREGDYLVLFQTLSTDSLATARLPTKVRPSDPIWFYDDPLGELIRQELGGQRIGCGSFVGNYAPERER